MFDARFEELAASIRSCSYTSAKEALTAKEALSEAHRLLKTTRQNGGIVYVIGNGGSAGIASHFSNDLMKALQVPSQTFYDSNLLTCLANDIGYQNIFSYPLEQMLKSQDLLVAISSSGKSPNILNAAETVRSRGASLMTLTGFNASNPLRSMGNLNFWIDRKDYGLVETAHFFLLHTMIDCWNKQVPDESKILRNPIYRQDPIVSRNRDHT